jgi:hypothetical protein
VVVALTCGLDRDWLKNLQAAGGGQLRRNGKTFAISNPEVVSKDEAATHVDGGWQRVFARLPFEQAVPFNRTP